jgi:hypothetical protein
MPRAMVPWTVSVRQPVLFDAWLFVLAPPPFHRPMCHHLRANNRGIRSQCMQFSLVSCSPLDPEPSCRAHAALPPTTIPHPPTDRLFPSSQARRGLPEVEWRCSKSSRNAHPIGGYWTISWPPPTANPGTRPSREPFQNRGIPT